MNSFHTYEIDIKSLIPEFKIFLHPHTTWSNLPVPRWSDVFPHNDRSCTQVTSSWDVHQPCLLTDRVTFFFLILYFICLFLASSWSLPAFLFRGPGSPSLSLFWILFLEGCLSPLHSLVFLGWMWFSFHRLQNCSSSCFCCLPSGGWGLSVHSLLWKRLISQVVVTWVYWCVYTCWNFSFSLIVIRSVSELSNLNRM